MLCLGLVMAFAPALFGRTAGAAGGAPAAELDRARYMPLSEVRPGMVGVGKTTLQGSQIVEFEAIVLAVLKRIAPRRDLIMVRCRGAGLEETGIVAGMSGSPVYVDGRLIGAVAYSFQWGKAPIAGVQPIGQVLAVSDEHPWARQNRSGAMSCPRPKRAASPTLTVPTAARGLANVPAALAGHETFDLRPIRTPVMVSGASPRALERLRKEFAPFGLVPMQGGAVGRELPPAARLEAGAPLGVGLMRGDMDITGMGTITEIAGDRLYGFGHAMFGFGEANYPLMTGVAQVVVPSLAFSFRMGAPVEEVGRLVWDEETAVFGRLGDQRAPMVPVEVTIRGPDKGFEERFRYEMVHHRLLSPILAGIGTINSIQVRSALPPDHTLRYRLDVKPAGREPIILENLAVSPDGDYYLFSRIVGLVRVLMENPFENLAIESVRVEARVEPASRLAEIQEARLLKHAVRPGGTVSAKVRIKPWRGEPAWVPVAVEVPEDFPEGTYRLTICGADEARRQEMQEAPARFHPRDLKGLLRMLRYDLTRNQLFARLEAPGEGLAVGTEELPNLPASMRAVLSEAAGLQVSPVRRSLVKSQQVPYVLVGETTLQVTVDRRAPEP